MASRDDDIPFREAVTSTPLAAYAAYFCAEDGSDVEEWLDIATTPLPETLRLNPLRDDKDWTAALLKKLGGKEIPWFSSPGGAWQMPWPRRNPIDEDSKAIIRALHETGRITRQEAASMLPVIALSPMSGEHILDLCAAPGSKTTQAAEAMSGEGVVLANEPNKGRANMLSTNRSRSGVANIVICQHDGRSFPKVPDPGFDRIIADVPCTGSATSRKNRSLWWNWKPSSGRAMHSLQLGIACRSAQLLRGGGWMVYSTCSIDPVENEAVVAELLRRCEWMKLKEVDRSKFPGLDLKPGVSDWRNLNDEVQPCSEEDLAKIAQRKPSVLSHTERELLGLEPKLVEHLSRCVRLQLGTGDCGGFFFALLHHEGEGEIAKTLVQNPDRVQPIRQPPSLNQHIPKKLPEEQVSTLQKNWGLEERDWSWWGRGRRVNIGTPEMRDWLYTPPRAGSKGLRWPGEHWHPVKVLHAGLPAFEERSGVVRPKAIAMPILATQMQGNRIRISPELMSSFLIDRAPLREMLDCGEEITGSVLVECEGEAGLIIAPGWLGARLLPMVTKYERLILSMQLGQ